MEITVTRALAELKLLDSRIKAALTAGSFVGVAIGNKPVQGYASEDDFKIKALARLQSAKDLIARRRAIKSAIVKSNAATIVKIANDEMTVAEAIERKTAIQYEQALLGQLRKQSEECNTSVERAIVANQARLDKFLEVIFGADKNQRKAEDVEPVSKAWLETNGARLVDPLNVKELIEKLDEEIGQYLTNVDFVLSEANATTKIVVS